MKKMECVSRIVFSPTLVPAINTRYEYLVKIIDSDLLSTKSLSAPQYIFSGYNDLVHGFSFVSEVFFFRESYE